MRLLISVPCSLRSVPLTGWLTHRAGGWCWLVVETSGWQRGLSVGGLIHDLSIAWLLGFFTACQVGSKNECSKTQEGVSWAGNSTISRPLYSVACAVIELRLRLYAEGVTKNVGSMFSNGSSIFFLEFSFKIPSVFNVPSLPPLSCHPEKYGSSKAQLCNMFSSLLP